MSEKKPQKSFTILVVEDDKFLRTLLVEKLKNEGMTVVEAENGQEGIVQLKKQPRPDAVLLDLLLPITDGFEVLRQAQKDPDVNTIPIMVLSNLGQPEDIERAKSLGAKEYVVKAYFTPSEIVEKLKSIIGGNSYL